MNEYLPKRVVLASALCSAILQSAALPVAGSAKPDFTSDRSETSVFYTGFDTQAEFNQWTQEGVNGGWKISSEPYKTYYREAPTFDAINPASTASLCFPRVTEQRNEAIISPQITVQKGDKLSFWSVTDPIWLVYARTQLIVMDGDEETVLWDNFLWNQFHPTDDAPWLKFDYALDDYAGKTINLKFLYTGADGEPVLIDDLKVSRADSSDDAKVFLTPGESVTFQNLTTGDAKSYAWSFPGGTPATSNVINPTVTYNTPGTYDVTLTVTDKDGIRASRTRKGYVTVSAKAPEAKIGSPKGHYYSPEANFVVPLNYELTFTDETEEDVDSRLWQFPGTDTPTSTEKSPKVKYIKAGQYDVDLSVTNSAGTSATYVHGINAGLKSLIWNIPASENESLAIVNLANFGYYGGSNWLDIPAFAEHFDAPVAPITIEEVNVYFGAATISKKSEDTQITVSICLPDANGLPGEVVASGSLPCNELIDASQTVNDPTTFYLETDAEIDSEFFVVIGDFPHNTGDEIAMFCSPRRKDVSQSTVYHQLIDYDENYKPLDTRTWVKSTDEFLSFAIAPLISFKKENSGIITPSEDTGLDSGAVSSNAPASYYTISGQLLPARPSLPGLYILRQGNRAAKIRIN